MCGSFDRRQGDHGVSLDAEDVPSQAIATVQRLSLLEIIVDRGRSAKSLNRPGLRRPLSLVKSVGVGAIIIAKLDRLKRRGNIREEKRGAGLGGRVARDRYRR